MSSNKGRILVADDDGAILRVVERALVNAGYAVETAADGLEAIAKLKTQAFDTLISDIAMPGMSGIDVLASVRQYDLDLPVVIMTGSPELETAVRAVEHGALRYLIKPFRPSELVPLVEYAVRMGHLARVKREAVLLLGDSEKFVGDRAALAHKFSLALAGIELAYQPIVLFSRREIFAYEALLRTREPTLGSPALILAAAEQLGRVQELGRTIRAAVARAATESPGFKVFVNLHALDLNDDELFSENAPLTAHAKNVVLEITERASLDSIRDLPARLKKLRALGYAIALDDLGAGYAGLTSLAVLEPEVVKLDMSLVRDVDTVPTKQKLVTTMARLSRELGMQVVVEGVETTGERDALVSLGCDLLQGYLFARPERVRPTVEW